MKSEIEPNNNLESVIPSMNINLPAPIAEDKKPSLVTEEMVLGMYGEILSNIRDDRKEIDQYIANFAEMVFNEPDGSTSSKEALVNLVKTKSETSDKMAKVADLLSRIFIKQDHFPAYLSVHAHQNNTIGDAGKRELLKQLDVNNKKKKKEESK